MYTPLPKASEAYFDYCKVRLSLSSAVSPHTAVGIISATGRALFVHPTGSHAVAYEMDTTTRGECLEVEFWKSRDLMDKFGKGAQFKILGMFLEEMEKEAKLRKFEMLRFTVLKQEAMSLEHLIEMGFEILETMLKESWVAIKCLEQQKTSDA